jgi:hypothetical protein
MIIFLFTQLAIKNYTFRLMQLFNLAINFRIGAGVYSVDLANTLLQRCRINL